jgi:hypothetical protein
MSRTTDPSALLALGQGLSAAAARLEPREAAQAAATLSQAMSRTTDPSALRDLAQGLSAVAARLEPREAARVSAQPASTLIQAMSKTTDPGMLRLLADILAALLSRENLASRLAAVTAAATAPSTPGAALAGPALLWPALTPPPPPLPTQTLVDLLKHPFCVAAARRLVLDQLQRHYHRPFADQWDFVRFAQQQKLDLDLSKPPTRPAIVAR